VQVRGILQDFFVSQIRVWWVEDFTLLGTLDLKKSYHHSGPSPMRPNKLWIRPHDGAARVQDPGCQRSSCRSIPRGRGGDHISITSDIVKVEGEDSRHPRLSKGGQGEEGCRPFSIVGASSFVRS